jgi:hypothetical protein
LNDRIFFGAFSLVFAGLLLWGIRSGEMPSKLGAFQRVKSPILYWLSAGLIGLFAVLSLLAAIRA